MKKELQTIKQDSSHSAHGEKNQIKKIAALIQLVRLRNNVQRN